MKQKIILGIFAILVLLNTASALSISAGPAVLEYKNMVKGGYAEYIITVGTGGDDELNVNVEIDGAIKDWVSLEPGASFKLIPKKRFELKVIVQPPMDVANGIYAGKIRIIADPIAKVSGGVGMAFGAAVGVTVKVEVGGEEIVSYKLQSVTAGDTEINYPVKFNIAIKNDGNVRVKPSIQINIFSDGEKKNLLNSVDYAEMDVLPSVTEDVLIEVPTTGMAVGQYWADVVTDMGGTQSLSFEVLKEGTLSMMGKLRQVKLSKIWVKQGETVKVSAYLVNEGELMIRGAKFVGEAFLVDEQYGTEQLLGTFESDVMNSPSGMEAELVAYFTPKQPGRYSIRGYILYEGKKTKSKGNILNVLSEPVNYTTYYMGIGIVVILIVYYMLQKGQDGRTRRFKRLWQNYLSIK